MIVEKGHFDFAEKYWGRGGQGSPAPPCSDGLVYGGQDIADVTGSCGCRMLAF